MSEAHISTIKGMNHVGISVVDLERSIAFYQDVLGMDVVVPPQPFLTNGLYEQIMALPDPQGRGALLKAGNMQIELFEFHHPAPKPSDPKRPVSDHGITHFCIEVADIGNAYKQLKEAGVSFHCPPLNFRGKAKATYARDPDGNVFELLEMRTNDRRDVFMSDVLSSKTQEHRADKKKSMYESRELIEAAKAGAQMQWGVKIPLRDGVHLNATLYLSSEHVTPTPAIFILTPYIAQRFHDVGLYFAACGYPFLAIDCRGRGNSEGTFRPIIQEAQDGYDVVEWLSSQSYCSGQVAMWGGSYGGAAQWCAAKEFPPHLVTITPAAATYRGVDIPIRNNIAFPHRMQWLTLVYGRAAQDQIFHDIRFWREKYRRFFEAGLPFKELDTWLGAPTPIWKEWLAHPRQDEYWDSYNPTTEQFSRLDIPILSITGIYDSAQLGALEYYKRHMTHATPEVRARHYLVIGPWDHSGTRTPKAEFYGITCGPASLIDMDRLHVEWYAWTMRGGPKPEFLQKNVTYYVMGAEKWRYADTLADVTTRQVPFYLHSSGNPTDVFASGALSFVPPLKSAPDHYVYDPRDVDHAAWESRVDSVSVFGLVGSANVTDQCMVHVLYGKQLVYHSAPLERDTEISGFFKLTLWLAIDQPDTDFLARIYEIGLDGGSLLLSEDWLRARYRESLREEKLITTHEPLRYDFERFTFVSREVKKGHRLRLTVGPVSSIYFQKNYNSGGVVAEESMKDARPVTVKLYHDKAHPSALFLPMGRQDD